MKKPECYMDNEFWPKQILNMRQQLHYLLLVNYRLNFYR